MVRLDVVFPVVSGKYIPYNGLFLFAYIGLADLYALRIASCWFECNICKGQSWIFGYDT